MGIWDLITGDKTSAGTGGIGALMGMTNAIVSLSGASGRDKGITTAVNGGVATLAGAQGVMAGINNLNQEGADKFGSGLGIFNSSAKGIGGILNLVRGGYAASGNKKAAGGWGAAAGILGALGGLGGTVGGIRSIAKAKGEDGKWDKKKVLQGVLGTISGLAGLGGGITGAINGIGQAQGKESKGLSTATGILGLLGSTSGALSSGLKLFGGGKAADQATEQTEEEV